MMTIIFGNGYCLHQPEGGSGTRVFSNLLNAQHAPQIHLYPLEPTYTYLCPSHHLLPAQVVPTCGGEAITELRYQGFVRGYPAQKGYNLITTHRSAKTAIGTLKAQQV